MLSLGDLLRALALWLFLAAATAAGAQTGGSLTAHLSTFAGMEGATASEVGARLNGTVYGDDPRWEEAIADYYETQDFVVPERESVPETAALPSADSLQLLSSAPIDPQGNPMPPRPALPPDYRLVVESTLAHGYLPSMTPEEYRRLSYQGIERLFPPEPGEQGTATRDSGSFGLGSLPAFTGCTFGQVLAAMEPLNTAGPDWGRFPMLVGAAWFARSAAPWLPIAMDLDAMNGTTYWTAVWHSGMSQMATSLIFPEMVEAPLRNAVRQAYEAASAAGAKSFAAVQPYFKDVVPLRKRALAQVAAVAADLRGRGCPGPADMLQVQAAHSFAVGEERRDLAARDPDYWHSFGLPPPRVDFTGAWDGDPVWLAELRANIGYLIQNAPAGPEADAVLSGAIRTEDALGPLPEAPTGELPDASADESADEGVAVGSAGAEDDAAEWPDPAALNQPEESVIESLRDKPDPFGPPTEEEEGAADSGGEPERGGDGSDRATVTQAQPPAPVGGETPGTWLTLAGQGSWPQSDLAGFWKVADRGAFSSDLTLIVQSEDGRHVEGVLVDPDGRRGEPWIVMDRDGQSFAWRGQVKIADLPIPPGTCGRWAEAALLAPTGAPELLAAWRGKAVSHESGSCSETSEQVEGTVRLERVVATAFQPVVADRFIHLIAVPGGGSTAAQYAAAVSFACSTVGLPPLVAEASSSAGTIVAYDQPCRWQLVMDEPGSYDIAVEFRGTDGTLLHRDMLRAELPPMPGLAQ